MFDFKLNLQKNFIFTITKIFFLIFSGFLLNAQDFYEGFGNDDGLEWLEQGEIQNENQNQNQKEFSESQNENPLSKLQENFTIIESVHLHNLNPHATSSVSDTQILTGLYEGLFSYNPVTLEAESALAVDYKISRDKKRWTFTLRNDARFSNGEIITAEHVKNSWIQLLATQNAPFASLFDIVKGANEFRSGLCDSGEVGIYATESNKITIHLVKPANYLTKLLCHSAFSVIHRNPTVYSGAFVLYDQNENSLILKKNPYYWDEKNTPLKQITVIQSDDIEENAYLFNTGVADWISAGVDTSKILNLGALQICAEFGTNYYFFKQSNAKPSYDGAKKLSVWDKAEFRNALLEAVPWEKIYENYMIPATTFVYPLANYPEVNGFGYTDENAAIKMMNEARKNEGISEDEILLLTILLPTGGYDKNIIQLLHDSWSLLGVDLQVREISSYYYLNSVKSSEADMFSYGWIGDFADPLTFLELFRSNSTLNDSGWSNSTYDELLEKASLVTDENERYKILSEAETILLDSGMVIPLSRPICANIVNLENVGGWANNAFNIHPLKYLYKKPFKSKSAKTIVLENSLD